MVGQQVFQAHRPAEVLPEPRLDGRDGEILVVLGPVDIVIGRTAVQPVAATLGQDSPGEHVGYQAGEHVEHTLTHGDVHVLALAGLLSGHQSGQDADGAAESATGIVGDEV